MEMTCTIIGGIILYFFVGIIFCGIEVRWHTYDRLFYFLGGDPWPEECNFADKMSFVIFWLPLVLIIILMLIKEILFGLIRIFIKPIVVFFTSGFRMPKKEVNGNEHNHEIS
ncbi:hypothetical protein KJ934_02880 [Patescibacteria group bacterium]|nr:hypothetical protein [Patescibacteria group bacterium]MBU4353303.1 hypothetical protein [Patescibacteria group bacterium]